MYTINGIQQIGLGTNDIYGTWQWYIDHFGFDMPVFDEEAEASLMLPYTEGKPRTRHAVLTLNYQGGGGLEIWKHTSFISRNPRHLLDIGDLGINASIIKVKQLERSRDLLRSKGINTTEIQYTSVPFFFTQDLHGNLIKIIESKEWFTNTNQHSGGVAGGVIGVTNIERSLPFYQSILGYDTIIQPSRTISIELFDKGDKKSNYKSVILRHSDEKNGAFSGLLGSTVIELVEAIDRKPNKIFEERMWGELGYIHLCFDVDGMDILKQRCEDAGHPFTVDSGASFDMGEAAGRFAYTEDTDGTLIEFVETHKVPILRKLNLYYNLKRRKKKGKLPRLFIKAMSLSRKKKVR